jgi:hypothetical protein
LWFRLIYVLSIAVFLVAAHDPRLILTDTDRVNPICPTSTKIGEDPSIKNQSRKPPEN